MGRIARICLFWLVAWWLVATSAVLAQETDEKSTFIKYVEEQISSDNFKISLNGIEGTLSSDVSLQSITIADRNGIWLTISQPRLIWSRSSLLVGELNVESLTADSIEVTRLPAPDNSAPTAEAKPFSLPQLPVSVLLQKIDIRTVAIDESVFGLASRLAVAGKLALDDELLDVDLQINRQDGAGGSFAVVANYADDKKWLKLIADLQEPENGVFATLLGIENRPPVALSVNGEGPISDFVMQLAFDVDDRPILKGNLTLAAVPVGQRIKARLSGPLATILPQQHRAFFGTNSQITTDAVLQENGVIDVSSFAIKTGNLDLDGRAKLMADGFLSALQIDLSILPLQAKKVRLPIASADEIDGTLLSALQLNVDYDAELQGGWTASLVAQGIERPDMAVENASLVASGVVANPSDPQAWQVTFASRGQLDGVSFADVETSKAFGDNAVFKSEGSWQAGKPLQLGQFELLAKAINLATSGQLADLTYTGNTRLRLLDLAAFSGIAGRELAGQANLRIDGSTSFLAGGFDLAVDGSASGLQTGTPTLDNLLVSDLLLAGRVARNQEGLSFEGFRLGNREFHTSIDGRYASNFSDLKLQAQIHDLKALSERASGPLAVNLSANGGGRSHKLVADIGLESGVLQNRAVRRLAAKFDGRIDGNRLNGTLAGSGKLDERPVSLGGQVDLNLPSNDKPLAFAVDDLIAEIGATRLNADLSKQGANPITGFVTIASTDISDVAALALVEASGQLNGNLEFLDTSGVQSLSAKLTARRLQSDAFSARSIDLVGSVVDLFDQPRIGATLNGRDIKTDAIEVPSVAAKIGTSGSTSTYEIQASIAQFDTRLEASGTVVTDPKATLIGIDQLNAKTSLANLRLRAPTRITISPDQTSIARTSVTVGKGRVDIAGSYGRTMALKVDLKNLPLAIVNAVQRNARAEGTISGQVKVGGTTASPIVNYNVKGDGITARQLASAGISALQVSIAGSFQDQIVQLKSLSASNRQNINLTASGRIPLTGNGLDLRAEGSSPLALAQSALASRGAKISGNARFNVNLKGSLQAPQPSGLLTIENGTLNDPLSNLKLVNIGLLAGMDSDRITITRSNANLSSGGSIALSGAVTLSDGLPANLTMRLNQARYTDGQTFSSQLDGALKLTGPLLADPTLSGTLNLAKTEIAVPDSFASQVQILEVEHLQPSASVTQTLERLEKATPKARPTSRPSVLRLDVTINAPNQIFVRGRGLDAELGGSIQVTGPVNNVSPIGSFELRRGRLTILGQRLELTEGSITLNGNLDPELNFVAETIAGEVTAYITVSGPASDIKVSFSSNPELPEDEVLAQIIFGRSIDDLSPSQIIKLASIAAELTGGSSPGLVDGLRRGTGLDDLDVVDDGEGETAVKAGKYINDNVYVGVQAGRKSQEATINLDITKDIKAKGSVDSEGSSSIGIFLEKDY
ncbi:MAG: translocation/assembly module TamB domain-containing protein [Rhizobiaceae bacterium]